MGVTRVRLAERVEPLLLEPDVLEVLKAVVLDALRWAWIEVGRRWPEIVTTGEEEEISAKMCSMLNDLDEIQKNLPALSNNFETVHRGAKMEGEGGGINYQPDLTFRPLLRHGVRNSGNWGWFVECKLINGGGSVTRYCKHGVRRFIDGRYAARMPSGAMLAYVRDGRQPFDSLRPVVGAYGSGSLDAPDPRTPEHVKSHHVRHHTPKPFEITHLWLQMSRNRRTEAKKSSHSR